MGTILKPAHLLSAGCSELLLETTSPVFFKGNYASVSYVTDATRTKIFEFPTGTLLWAF